MPDNKSYVRESFLDEGLYVPLASSPAVGRVVASDGAIEFWFRIGEGTPMLLPIPGWRGRRPRFLEREDRVEPSGEGYHIMKYQR